MTILSRDKEVFYTFLHKNLLIIINFTARNVKYRVVIKLCRMRKKKNRLLHLYINSHSFGGAAKNADKLFLVLEKYPRLSLCTDK